MTRMVRYATAKDMVNVDYKMFGARIDCVATNKNGVKEHFISIDDLMKKHELVKTVIVNISGINAHLSNEKPPNERFPLIPLNIYYEKPHREQIIRLVSDYIDFLFGTSKNSTLDVYRTCEELPKVLKNKKTRIFFVPEPPVRVLEEFFSGVPEQELIEIYLNKVNGQLTSESKFYKAQVLNVHCAFSMAPEILLNFKGRRLYVTQSECDDDDIIQFINRWKTQQYSQKLEVLDIGITMPFRTNLERINEEAQLKELLTPITWTTIKPPPRDDGLSFGDNEITFQSYVVKENGIVAYVTVTHLSFVLYVQNFTEDQLIL